MYKVIVFLGIFFSLVSCSKEEVYTSSVGGKWNKNKEFTFDFDVQQPQEKRNIIFVVRNNNDYPYSNIRLIVNFTELKNKKIQTDTLNYILAKPNGEWIGSGFGSTKEILFQYRMDHQFKQPGNYRIGIKQAMRKDNLPGIEDVGIKIQNIKP